MIQVRLEDLTNQRSVLKSSSIWYATSSHSSKVLDSANASRRDSRGDLDDHHAANLCVNPPVS